jgi:membrane-bound lytic murein transglycosylase F
VIEPVQRDLAEIKSSGVLRMITNYSSNSYFLHRGIEMGFEYELLNAFAEQNDLALEIIIIEPDENPYDILNSGDGDVIAANYAITPERRKFVNFTRPYNLVDQVLVYNETIFNEMNNQNLINSIPVTVNRNSSYYPALSKYRENEARDIGIQLTQDDIDTEALLLQVSNGTFEATVADENIFNAASAYMNNLIKGPTISRYDTIAWAVRKNAPDLETAMSRFLYKHFRFGQEKGEVKRSEFLNVLRQKYFEKGMELDGFFEPEQNTFVQGSLSPFDDLIKQKSDKYDLDWVMVTAMMAQESKFNVNSESWAGAVGLMQVIPRFSPYSRDSLFIPEINVEEGTRIIREHLDHYAYMDSTNQWAFALATYNAGSGHVADARRLVIDQNKDPNEWEHVSEALLKLMQRKYYQSARYGFTRGIETVRYVNEILNRHKTYNSVLSAAERRNYSLYGTLGLKTVN